MVNFFPEYALIGSIFLTSFYIVVFHLKDLLIVWVCLGIKSPFRKNKNILVYVLLK
jgi:hypothetical protein